MNDSELFNLWLHGSSSAGLALLGKYRVGWERYLRRRLGADYEDILQQAMLACVEGHRNFRTGGNFGSYMFGILRNKLHSRARDRRREREVADALQCEMSLVASAERGHDDLAAVEVAVASLPTQLREVVVMRYIMRMTRNRVAESLGVPPGTIGSRERRAKTILRQLIAARSRSANSG